MKIYEEIVNPGVPTAIALGFFDGVHKGHKKVISKTVSFKNSRITPCVFTFKNSPKETIYNTKIEPITNVSDKISKFESLGIEILYIIDFKDIKNISALNFVSQILKKKLNAKILVCGENYHFGKGGKATALDLKKISKNFGINTYIEKLVMYKNSPISSTKIRSAISNNDTDYIMNTI